jgi:hypothetical protein
LLGGKAKGTKAPSETAIYMGNVFAMTVKAAGVEIRKAGMFAIPDELVDKVLGPSMTHLWDKYAPDTEVDPDTVAAGAVLGGTLVTGVQYYRARKANKENVVTAAAGGLPMPDVEAQKAPPAPVPGGAAQPPEPSQYNGNSGSGDSGRNSDALSIARATLGTLQA